MRLSPKWGIVVCLATLAPWVPALGVTTAAGASVRPAAIAGPGYWLITGYGTSFAYGAPYLGSPEANGDDTCVNSALSGPLYACDGISTAPGGQGYWISSGSTAPPGCYDAASGKTVPCPARLPYSGSVYFLGVVPALGEGPGAGLIGGASARIVGIAAAATGAWLVGADGGVFSELGARFFGSLPALGVHPAAAIVGMTATPDGKGYWLAGSDGGVFAFGDAQYVGSMGGRSLNAPIVGMTATPDGKGYWLVGSDGGVFAFGDARFLGSMGGKALAAAMVGIGTNPDGTGYWTVAADGGVFAFGDAPFLGSAVGQFLDAPIVGIATKG